MPNSVHDARLSIGLPHEIVDMLNVESQRRGISRLDLMRQLLGYREGHPMPTKARFSEHVRQCLGEAAPAPDLNQERERKRHDQERAKAFRKLIHFATTPR